MLDDCDFIVPKGKFVRAALSDGYNNELQRYTIMQQSVISWSHAGIAEEQTVQI